MTTEVSQPTDSQPTGPPDVPPPSRTMRLLTSWKLWACALVVALVAIGTSLGVRGYQRYQALRYLDEQVSTYVLTADREWITNVFGDWAKGFRDVDSIELLEPSEEAFLRISVFVELRSLTTGQMGYFHDGEITDRGIHALSQLSRLEEFHGGSAELSDAQFAEIFSSGMPLKKVAFVHGDPSQQTLTALSRIPTLTSLELMVRAGLYDESFRDVPSFENLQHLSIIRTGPQRLLWIQDLPRLESLEIQSDAITWELVEVLRGLPNFKQIRVLWGNIQDPHLQEALEKEWEVEYASFSNAFGHRSGGGAAFY